MEISKVFDVKGKIVLVTGGARGVGRMISEGFVANGAKVYISSRDASACARACDELNKLGEHSGGSAHYIPANFYKLEDCQKLAQELSKREKKLDVLVNNSGSIWRENYEKYPDSAWTRVLTLNLQRVFTITQLLTPLLEVSAKEGGKENPARVINIGSVNGESVPMFDTFAYSASKAGLHHLSRVLAYHLGLRNITSNTLACGPFESKMIAVTLEKHRETIENGIPLRRIGEPKDVAGACLFLASRAGAFVNGATIPLDGGLLISARL